jgi:predicted transcriptional regulator
MDIAIFKGWGFLYNPVTDEPEEFKTKRGPGEAQQIVLQAIKEGCTSSNDIADKTGIQLTCVRTTVNKLVRHGLIAKNKDTGKYGAKTFYLTEEGKRK